MSGRQGLLLDLCAIVGRRHLLTGAHDTMRFRRGFRTPAGEVVAVVRPATLVEMWRVLVRLVKSDIAIIIQASNTGLTGGSTPDDRIDRPVVIVSTTRLRAIHLIDGGRQAISLPGATLGELEQRLAPLGREPHSVIGSTCFGASVVGGICNNSGGALIRRGPAFTELALFAQVDEAGRLSLVNRLGVELGDDPEAMLARLESGDFLASPSALRASDTDYEARVRATDEASPARFNSDPRCLHDAAGSAGRIAVFAVRTDSFPRAAPGTTFYIGSNDPGDLTRLRRTMLAAPGALPISAEYIHCDAFDIADHYGRDIFYAIRLLGTRRLPVLNAVKARVDAAGDRIGIAALADRFLHLIGRFLPRHLPQRLRKWRDLYAHHLILKVDAAGVPAAREILRDVFQTSGGGAFECTVDEAEKAMLHRFVVASAAVRYQAVRRHDFAGLVSLDVALPRNAAEWDGAGEEAAPGSIAARLVYGHFFCHVFHRDYLVVPGFDPAEVKAALLASLDAAGGEYPAEHNVGRQYRAKPALEAFYRTLDPTNRFNPGIGLTATGPDWSEPANFGEMA